VERVQHILINVLKMRYICVQWVPHSLTQMQLETRLKICQENLKLMDKLGDKGLSRLLTGDEAYVYFYDNLSSKEAKMWVFENNPPPKLPVKDYR
jgi:hypothetical protein